MSWNNWLHTQFNTYHTQASHTHTHVSRVSHVHVHKTQSIHTLHNINFRRITELNTPAETILTLLEENNIQKLEAIQVCNTRGRVST